MAPSRSTNRIGNRARSDHPSVTQPLACEEVISASRSACGNAKCNVNIPFCKAGLTFLTGTDTRAIGHRDPRPTPRPPGRRPDRPKPWRPGAPQAADAAAGARPCRAGAGEPAHPLRDCGRALQGTLGGLRTARCATPCPLPVRQVAKRRSSVGDTRGITAVHGTSGGHPRQRRNPRDPLSPRKGRVAREGGCT